MDLRNAGNFFAVLEDMLDLAEQEPEKSRNNNRNNHHPSREYVRDAKAMAATPADVVEYPNAYVFVVDMPGIEAGEIKVQVENDNVLVLSGERGREKEIKESGVKYVRMERRVGKFMRKFVLPENANLDAISAVAKDCKTIESAENVSRWVEKLQRGKKLQRKRERERDGSG